MRFPTVIIISLLFLILVCIGFLVRARWHNHLLKEDAENFAVQAGRMQAQRNFSRGRYILYEFRLYKGNYETDSGRIPLDGDVKPTGRTQGPYEIWYWVIDTGWSRDHQALQQAHVNAYNEQMHQFFEQPHLFDTNGLPAGFSNAGRKNTNGPSQGALTR